MDHNDYQKHIDELEELLEEYEHQIAFLEATLEITQRHLADVMSQVLFDEVLQHEKTQPEAIQLTGWFRKNFNKKD